MNFPLSQTASAVATRLLGSLLALTLAFPQANAQSGPLDADEAGDAMGGGTLTSARGDCMPRWVKHTPLQAEFLRVPIFGEGRSNAEALAAAEANAPVEFARMTSARVTGYEQITGHLDVRSFRVDVLGPGSGGFREETSDFCRTGNRVQVWLLVAIPVKLYWNRIRENDQQARGIDFPGIWARYVNSRRAPTSTEAFVWSLYAPGAIQLRSGRNRRGALILGGVVGGAAFGLGGYYTAKNASANAAAESANPARRDFYNRENRKWFAISRVGWIAAGSAYLLGLGDAVASNPNALVSWRLSRRTSLNLILQ